LCSVCGGDDVDPDDEIILCDGAGCEVPAYHHAYQRCGVS